MNLPMSESVERRAAAELADFRRRIDSLDDELVALLGRRFSIIREVAAVKQAAGIPAFLPDRVMEVIRRSADLAPGHRLDPSFVAALYDLIVGESCRLEERLIHGGEDPAACAE
jgi:4-amino-4-deoxychorismate mutase